MTQRTTPTRVGLPPNLKALYVERHAAVPHEIISTCVITGHDHEGTPTREEHQVVRVDRERAPKVAGFWLLPIHTNPDRTLGTFLRLYDTGRIEQVTLRSDDPGEDVWLIKPEDK